MKRNFYAPLLTVLCLGALGRAYGNEAPDLKTQSLRDYLLHQVETGALLLPDFSPEGGGRETDVEAGEPLLKLYAPALESWQKKHKEKGSWKAQSLPTRFQLPSAEPTGKYYNTSILWFEDAAGFKVLGFRPVDTPTGCHSGCTPVVFHLQLSPAGTVQKIIEEPAKPLRKRGHEVLSPSDKTKLLKLAQVFPKALKDIESGNQLTDPLSHFPPQTWTVFQGTVVPGAAYTSYRVYQAALQCADFVHPQPSKDLAAATAIQGLLSQLLSAPNGGAALEVAKRMAAQVEKHAEAPLRRFALSWLPYVLLWADRHGASAETEAFAKKYFAHSEYQSVLREPYCVFLKNALDSAVGAKLIAHVPACSPETAKLFPLLAAAATEDSAAVKALSASWDFKAVPPLVLADAHLLALYLFAAQLSAHTTEATTLAAQLKLRFPRSAAARELPKTLVESREFSSALAQAEQDYRAELGREFLTTPMAFPRIEAQQGERVVPLPLKDKKLQIYLFFAAWCPHCQETVKGFVKSEWPQALWERVQPVQIFVRNSEQLKQFCELTGMPAAVCKRTLTLPDESSAPGFYESMALYGVPRFVLTDSQGRIVVFDFKIPQSEGSDVARDLLWTLEEINKR